MASGTINGTTSNEYIDCKIEWSSVPDIDTNTSEVTASLYYKRNNKGYSTSGAGFFSITIDGKTSGVSSEYLIINRDSWVLAKTFTTTVEHDEDGGALIAISATGHINGTPLKSTNCSDKMVLLDHIPRAAYKFFVLDSNNDKRYLGNPLETSWFFHALDKSDDLYEPLLFEINFSTKTEVGADAKVIRSYDYPKTFYSTDCDGGVYETSTVAPLIFAEDYPNTNHVRAMYATLYTYLGYGRKLLGSKETWCPMYIPENDETKPKLELTAKPVTSLGEPFSDLYIQGKSKIEVSLSSDGQYKATITSSKISMLGDSCSSTTGTCSCTSDYIYTSGPITVTGNAEDSRGFTNNISKEITVIPYSSPKILPASDDNRIICARCAEDGNLSNSGTYLKIKARRSYFTVTSEGEQKNFCEIRYRYRTELDTDFSDWITILDKSKIDTDTIDLDPIPDVVSATDTAYVVQVGVVDDVGESDVSTFNIPTDFVVLDIPEGQKGKRIGVGRYAANSSKPGIDIALDMYFDEGIKIHGAFSDTVAEIGLDTHETSNTINGSWWYRKWESGTYDISGIFTVQPTESTSYEGGVGYYSNPIQIKLPFDIVSVEYTGTPAEQHYWLINATLDETDNSKISFQLARFIPIDTTKAVTIRLVGHGRWKETILEEDK